MKEEHYKKGDKVVILQPTYMQHFKTNDICTVLVVRDGYAGLTSSNGHHIAVLSCNHMRHYKDVGDVGDVSEDHF